MENNTDINFEVLLQNHPSKIASNMLAIVTIILFVPLYYFIAWYEQNGLCNKKTLINQLNAYFCQNIVAYLVFVMGGDILVSMLNPLPAWYCHLQVFLKGLSVYLLIVTIDVILLVKYAFIFWLKNPASVLDGFWIVFLGLWILGFTFVSQLIYFFLPGKQPLHFYICTGIFPVEQQLLLNKARWHSIIIITVSLVACTIMTSQIKMFQRKLSQVQNNGQRSIVKTLEESIFESKASFVLIIALLVIISAFIVVNNMINPATLNHYPSYDLYWAAYCVPKLLVSCFWLLLILNKKATRQEFVKKARSIIQRMKSGADAINISGLLV